MNGRGTMLQERLERLSQQHVLVMGYAVTGKSVVEFLLERGARVTLNDRGNLTSDSSVALLLEQGVTVVDQGHPVTLLDGIDFIVKNPGIPYHLEILQEAQQRQIPIYTDVELAYWTANCPIVGITGSNGKTTTTSLIQQIVEAGLEGHAYLAGNIGVPSLQTASQATIDDVMVMELSSFQLMGTAQFRPNIAVMTNITSAHLDYHGTQEAYEQAKFSLLAHQTVDDYVVYNLDNGTIATYFTTQEVKAKRVPYTLNGQLGMTGAYVYQEQFYFNEQVIAPVSDLFVPGKHNIENALAAIAVAKILGIDNDVIQAQLKSYQGMPYRLQLVGEYDGRKFYNDSKSTNIEAAITALTSFKQPIHYIGGGLDRGVEFDRLTPYMEYVKTATVYGESREKMARAFREAGISTLVVEKLEEALDYAYSQAQPEEVVLFSPSNASWDQYKNFEVRGAAFNEHLQRLVNEAPYTGGQV